MRNFLLSLFMLLFLMSMATSSSAQNANSTRANAMGGTGIGLQDINSIITNQAGIANLTELSGILSAQNRFQLAALNTFTAGVAYPTSAGVFGLVINYFGFEEFNQQRIGIAYARKLLSNLAIGAEINVHNFQIPEYGSTGLLSFDLGMQYDVSKSVVVGARVSNPIQQELADGENLPTLFQFGFSYMPSKKVLISAEAEKEIASKPSIRFGVEYQLIQALHLRIGAGTQATLMSFGLGVNLPKGIKIDIGTSFHQQLDWTTGISFLYQPINKKK